MRKFFVSYLVKKEPKCRSIVLYEKECETVESGNLALLIRKEIEEIEKSGSYDFPYIVLINFWEIYDKT